MRKDIAIVSIVIALIVGFFLGSEYTKYKVRTAINEGLSSLGDAFGGSTSPEKEEETEIVKIPVMKGDSYTLSGANGEGQISAKIRETADRGKEYQYSDYSGVKAIKTVSSVVVEIENTGKVGSFLGTYGTKLITADGYEYSPIETVQMDDVPDGYSGCISCENNPGDKSISEVLFDIEFKKLNGAKIIFGDSPEVEFQL